MKVVKNWNMMSRSCGVFIFVSTSLETSKDSLPSSLHNSVILQNNKQKVYFFSNAVLYPQRLFKIIKITLGKLTFPSYFVAYSTIDLLNAILHQKTMNQCP